MPPLFIPFVNRNQAWGWEVHENKIKKVVADVKLRVRTSLRVIRDHVMNHLLFFDFGFIHCIYILLDFDFQLVY